MKTRVFTKQLKSISKTIITENKTKYSSPTNLRRIDYVLHNVFLNISQAGAEDVISSKGNTNQGNCGSSPEHNNVPRNTNMDT